MKSKLISGLIIVSLIVYYLGVDPDLDLVKYVTFGIPLINVLNVFVLSSALITMIEVLPRWLIDDGVDNEREIVKDAMQNATGSGLVYVGISLRVMAYSFITGLVTFTYLHS